ncbi:MAG: PD-(D/E)XK nuclease family protein [Candidatus Roizmanbacteria bacterium]|nr:PD-(D/E)XK nuclease family protein [Candidatus Roizmanbacteria bacterium]
MLKLSPSKIATYKQCPLKYKCEIDTQIRKAYKQETPPLTFGNLIHGCLNDFFKRVDKSQRNFETLRKLFEEKFKKNFEKHRKIFKTKENIIQYVKEAHRQFKTFISSKFVKGNPFLIEEFPIYRLNQELELGGKFDRVDLVNDKLTLIDYKTGKYSDEKYEDNRFQLDFYEYLLAKIYPKYQVAKKILFYLKENKVEKYEKSEDLNQVEKEIVDIADTIKDDTELKPRRNSLCSFCDYREICPIFIV